MKLRPEFAALLFLLATLPATLLAQDPAPASVRDLIGARASSGESALKDRGWEVYKTEKGSDRIWTNWWNQASFTCMTVVTLDGRYDSIVTTSTVDCGIAGPPPHGSGQGDDPWFKEYIGGRPAAAEAEFERRDFSNVDGTKDGYRSMTWWHRASIDRCLKMTVSDGRVEDIVFDRDGCRGGGSHAGAPPEIIMGSNNEGEVIFSGNNCVVYFDSRGYRTRNLPACSGDQIDHAEKAMRGYRSEQGIH